MKLTIIAAAVLFLAGSASAQRVQVQRSLPADGGVKLIAPIKIRQAPVRARIERPKTSKPTKGVHSLPLVG